MKEKYNSWSEYSDDFIKEHPELYDRVGMKISATFTLTIDTYSDFTDYQVRVEMARALLNNEGTTGVQLILL